MRVGDDDVGDGMKMEMAVHGGIKSCRVVWYCDDAIALFCARKITQSMRDMRAAAPERSNARR